MFKDYLFLINPFLEEGMLHINVYRPTFWFLGFFIIISAVLSENNFVGPFLDNTISSRMEEIYFAYLAPETEAINSASIDIVTTVAFT